MGVVMAMPEMYHFMITAHFTVLWWLYSENNINKTVLSATVCYRLLSAIYYISIYLSGTVLTLAPIIRTVGLTVLYPLWIVCSGWKTWSRVCVPSNSIRRRQEVLVQSMPSNSIRRSQEVLGQSMPSNSIRRRQEVLGKSINYCSDTPDISNFHRS